jgi:hypothetical protein
MCLVAAHLYTNCKFHVKMFVKLSSVHNRTRRCTLNFFLRSVKLGHNYHLT